MATPRLSARAPWRSSSVLSSRRTSAATASASEATATSAARSAASAAPVGKRCPAARALSRWMRNSTRPLQASSCFCRQAASSFRLLASGADGARMTLSSCLLWLIILSYSSSSCPEMPSPPAAAPAKSAPSSGPGSPSPSSSRASPAASTEAAAAVLPSSPKSSRRSTLRPRYFASTGTCGLSRKRPSAGSPGPLSGGSRLRPAMRPAWPAAAVSSPRSSASVGSGTSRGASSPATRSASAAIHAAPPLDPSSLHARPHSNARGHPGPATAT
mmetsp:Transcript_59679/g.192034  ORF Transcript_59679/g.192034 Transcript_59679/m.192034 type:complete len:273 (-) Transcript_59679:12-830(-)